MLASSSIRRLTLLLSQASIHGEQQQGARYMSAFRTFDRKKRKKKSATERQLQPNRAPPNTNPMQVDVQPFRQPPNLDVMDQPGELGERSDAVIKLLREQRKYKPDVEEQLHEFDYLTSRPGSLEDLVGERRALMDFETEKEREEFLRELDEGIDMGRSERMGLGDDDLPDKPYDPSIEMLNRDNNPYYNIGNWSEVLFTVDRVQKVQKGGTMLRYRALVVGGNSNGVIGFGVGKANGPEEATIAASRKAKKNIIFVEPFMGRGLTNDLVGKHNSCLVHLRATGLKRPLKGNPMVSEILKRAGITCCSSKSHGNRNPYNIVRATFKALMTHDSIEEIAMKRGRRFINMDRAKRLQLT